MLASAPEKVLLKLGALEAIGVELTLADERLTYRGPAKVISKDVLSFIAEHRALIRRRLAFNELNPKVFRATLVQKQYMNAAPGTPAVPLNNCMLTKVSLCIDESSFRDAVRRVLDHNLMFRAVFFYAFGDSFFYFPKDVNAFADWLDLSELSPELQRQELDTLHSKIAASILDSASGDVLRLMCVKTSETDSEIILCAHYVVSDGSTLMSFMHQLVEVIQCPEQPLNIVDVASHLDQLAARDEENYARADQTALKELLGELPCHQSTFAFRETVDKMPPALSSMRMFMDGDELNRVKRYAKFAGVTPFVVLLACYCDALFHTWERWNGLLSIATSMRVTDEDIDCPGPRVNSIILNVPRREWNLSNLVRFSKVKMDALRRFGSMPIDQFFRDRRKSELESVMRNWNDIRFNYLKFPFRSSRNVRQSIIDFDMIPTHGSTLLNMYLWDADYGLHARMVYRSDIIDSVDVEAIWAKIRLGLQSLSFQES